MKSISIMELTAGRCACLVPEEPYPRYCGAPVDPNNPYRMCHWHGKAYLERRSSDWKQKGFTPHKKNFLPNNPRVAKNG